jgi:hypothetical protein
MKLLLVQVKAVAAEVLGYWRGPEDRKTPTYSLGFRG